MSDDDKITLDSSLVLKAITGEDDETKALSALFFPHVPPPLAELDSKWSSVGTVDPPRILTEEERVQYEESLKREIQGQNGVIVNKKPGTSVVTLARALQPFYMKEGSPNRCSRQESFAQLDFGWLPLEEYSNFTGRRYLPDGKTLITNKPEPRTLDTATFVSAVVQYRKGLPSHLELLIFSDPVATAPDETTTIKVVFVFTRLMPEAALNRPQWLIDVLSQEVHKVARTTRKAPREAEQKNVTHRLTKDGTWQAYREVPAEGEPFGTKYVPEGEPLEDLITREPR